MQWPLGPWAQSPDQEDPLEEGMALQLPWSENIHFSILAWRIPWTEEPGGPRGCKESDWACMHNLSWVPTSTGLFPCLMSCSLQLTVCIVRKTFCNSVIMPLLGTLGTPVIKPSSHRTPWWQEISCLSVTLSRAVLRVPFLYYSALC